MYFHQLQRAARWAAFYLQGRDSSVFEARPGDFCGDDLTIVPGPILRGQTGASLFPYQTLMERASKEGNPDVHARPIS